jgi:hypothetical protein
MSRRKCAEITTSLAPALAEVERLLFVAMNVRSSVLDLPRLNYFGATEALGSLSILGVLKSFVPPSQRSFYGLRSCLDLAYTWSGTQGATRVFLSAKVILTTIKAMQVVSVAQSLA